MNVHVLTMYASLFVEGTLRYEWNVIISACILVGVNSRRLRESMKEKSGIGTHSGIIRYDVM
jgi:hypothetical protein